MQSSSRNGAKVVWLAVHTTEGIMRARDLRDWKSWAGSSHAANDETGVLLSGAGDGFVSYDRAAWTLRNGNAISDNLEQCGWARWTRAEWLARPKLLETTAQWLAARSKARGIPLRRLSHAEIRARKPGVIGHGDYTKATGDGTHWDPGPGYPWDVVIARAEQLAAGGSAAAIRPEDPFMALSDAAQKKLADQIDTLSEWSKKKVKSRRGTGAPVLETTLFDTILHIEGEAYRTERQIAGLTAAVDKLAGAVAKGDPVTADELRAAVREEMAKVVRVEVSVDGTEPPA